MWSPSRIILRDYEMKMYRGDRPLTANKERDAHDAFAVFILGQTGVISRHAGFSNHQGAPSLNGNNTAIIVKGGKEKKKPQSSDLLLTKRRVVSAA